MRIIRQELDHHEDIVWQVPKSTFLQVQSHDSDAISIDGPDCASNNVACAVHHRAADETPRHFASCKYIFADAGTKQAYQYIERNTRFI